MGSITKEQRSKIMASIHSKDTKPEMIVRRYLHACCFRYILNSPLLPGHPDLFLRKYITCIFVNGCFWHGHDCKDFVPPKTNTEFWTNKINRNKERDINVQKQLATMGWHCIVVWECELKKDSREQTLCSLEYTLNHIFLKDHEVRYLPLEQDQQLDIAAEREL